MSYISDIGCRGGQKCPVIPNYNFFKSPFLVKIARIRLHFMIKQKNIRNWSFHRDFGPKSPKNAKIWQNLTFFEILPVFWPYFVIEWTVSHQISSWLTEFCLLANSVEVYHSALLRQTSQGRAVNCPDCFNSLHLLTCISKRPHPPFLNQAAPKALKRKRRL